MMVNDWFCPAGLPPKRPLFYAEITCARPSSTRKFRAICKRVDLFRDRATMMSSKPTTNKSKAGIWEGEEDELAVLIYKSSKTAKLRAEAAAAAAAVTEEQMHVSSASAGRRTSTRKRSASSSITA